MSKNETKNTKELEAQAKEQADAKAIAQANAESEALAKAESDAKKAAQKSYGVDELANKHRIPSWQTAALVRLMGWEEGKLVTDDEYKKALQKLTNRRIGG